MSEEARLERIENKIDQLSDAVVSLARMEERMITLFNRMDGYDRRQQTLEEKVDGIDTIVTKRGAILSIVDRAVWVFLGIVGAVWARKFL